MSDSATMLEAFKFIESAAADDDPDTEEALKGFDFLASPEELDGSEPRSGEDSGEWGEIGRMVEKGLSARKVLRSHNQPQFPLLITKPAQNTETGQIGLLLTNNCDPLKHFLIQNPDHLQDLAWHRPVSGLGSLLNDMLANLRDTEELPPMQPALSPPCRPSVPRLNEHEVGSLRVHRLRLDGSQKLQNIISKSLFSLMITSQITNNTDALRKTWNPKFTLRSHFDSVRSLAFHPVEPVLVTASEDHTLKLCAALDVEPIFTFRAHSGAVLSVTMSSSGDQCFSGGVDGTIQSWNMPSPNIDPYDSYGTTLRSFLVKLLLLIDNWFLHPLHPAAEASILRGALCGHTDSVWGLVYSSVHHRLLSCSADGTVRLWNAADISPALAVFNEDGDLGVANSVDLVSSDPAYMVTSFDTGHIGLFNMETQQLFLTFDSAGPPGTTTDPQLLLSDISEKFRSLKPRMDVIDLIFIGDNSVTLLFTESPCKINQVLSHPTLPITITAQEDRHIQFFDNNTGGASPRHDCSIRLWNMESKTCIQEFTAHRKKFDESIHDVAFHPTKCYIGSAGADALAKVFV
ncbi:hypothetical protein GOODEAATRI_018547 [Goodea atripinnis]|uniref:Striatin n=1 Tax=Goodea atripinnis TaxID=208336 RepID=A0ABV0NLB5_9TELE